jgi:transcriptional regulator with XRE-family HTH domain
LVIKCVVMAEEDDAGQSLGDVVRLARTGKGLTQAQAAKLVGVHKNAWQNWERDVSSPEMRLRAIEEALGYEEGWFELHLDPFAFIAAMAKDLEAIRRQLDGLETLVRRLL